MSPELETLDQLLGGDMSLAIIRTLYPDDATFLQSVMGLLSCRDVRLLTADGNEVPQWSWRQLFSGPALPPELDNLRLRITAHGARRTG